MRLSLALLGLLPLAIAAPAPVQQLELIKRQYAVSNTQNQLTDGTPCRAITVIFARGTFETGNVGTLVGPPFFQGIANITGADKLAVQGVEYAADVDGFYAGGDAAGSAKLASLAIQAQTQCPDTKIVLSGYSQGGQLVHNAAKTLTDEQSANINSVVIFGDPDYGQPVGSIPSSKVLVICHDGDNICEGGDTILPQHLDYANDAGTAARFVVQQAGNI